MMTPDTFEKVLEDNADIIESFTWITPAMKNIKSAKMLQTKVTDKAKINSFTVGIYAV